ncbi:MAG: DUF4129 domain-containing protein [Spirochaetota bacterium]
MATPRHEALYREVIHPALAVAPPLLGVSAAASLAEELLGFAVLTPLFLLLAVAAATVEVVVGNLVWAARGGRSARLREFLVVAGLAYLLFALTAGDDPAAAASPFAPRGELLAPLVLVAAAWLAVHRRHEAFRPREDLLRSVAGRSGRELRHVMRDTRGFATDILLRLRHNNTTSAVGLFLLLLGATVVWAAEREVSERSLALIAAYAVIGGACVGVTNSFHAEIAAYGEGVRVPTRYLRRIAVAGALIIILALILSLPFVRDASAVSPEVILGFLEGLQEHFERPDARLLPDPRPFTMPPLEQMVERYDVPERTRSFTRFLEIFARIFRAVVYTAAALSAAAFVLWPLFTRRFRRQVAQARLGRRLLIFLAGLLALAVAAVRTLARPLLRLLALGRRLGDGRRNRRRNRPGNRRKSQDESTAASRGRGKRGGTGRRLRRQRSLAGRLLEEIAEEGEKKGVPRTPSHTAREHSLVLQNAYPPLGECLPTVVDTAERALYSSRRLSAEETHALLRAARDAVRTLRGLSTPGQSPAG